VTGPLRPGSGRNGQNPDQGPRHGPRRRTAHSGQARGREGEKKGLRRGCVDGGARSSTPVGGRNGPRRRPEPGDGRGRPWPAPAGGRGGGRPRRRPDETFQPSRRRGPRPGRNRFRPGRRARTRPPVWNAAAGGGGRGGRPGTSWRPGWGRIFPATRCPTRTSWARAEACDGPTPGQARTIRWGVARGAPRPCAAALPPNAGGRGAAAAHPRR